MSRAEYLSKYLSGDDKRKKKKSKKVSVPSPVVIGGARNIPNMETSNDMIAAANEPDNEFLPTKVENISEKQLKGFKRIDDGKEVKQAGSPLGVALQQSQTVYRDQSGRIVNLEEKRQQLKEEKKLKAAEVEKLRDQINTGELDAIKRKEAQSAEMAAKRFDVSKDDRDYVYHMKHKSRFEDPLSIFGATAPKNEETSKTGRPVYTGGMHPANRFKIKAGYFWDGIDRANGFEDRLIEKRNHQHVQKMTKKASKESYSDYDFD